MLAPLLLAAAVIAQAPASAPPAAPPAPGPALHTTPRPSVDPAPPGPGEGPLLTLDEAQRAAEQANPDLRAARARLDEARAGVAAAWAAYLPQISASATYTHNSAAASIGIPTTFEVRDVGVPGTPAGGALPGAPTTLVAVPSAVAQETVQSANQLTGQIDASQALFAPRAWYGIGAARLGSSIAGETLESARRDLALGVASTYYLAAALRKAVEIQERQLAIAVSHEKDAKIRFDAGTVPKITYLRAEIDRTRAEQDLKRAQNSYAAAKVSLATLLDRPGAKFEVEVPPPPRRPAAGEDLEASALQNRPDVRAAVLGIDLQRETRKGTISTYLPTVGAFGRYQVSNTAGFSGQKNTWAIGLQASWNLLDGGLREATLRDESARIVEAEASRRGTENRALEEVRRAKLDLDSAVANRSKAEEQVRLAEENQRLVEVNFKAGAATYLEVSDANSELQSSSLTLVTETLNAYVASVQLLKAAGQYGGTAGVSVSAPQ
jgi:outer membrane protein TolC